MMDNDVWTIRNNVQSRWSALRSERSSWVAHWREISMYLLPRNGRFFTSDRNNGGKRHNNIYDSTATKALRVLGAGMMAGSSSPARPWFRLGTPDPGLSRYLPVREWLDDVTRLMQAVFQKSNTYRTLHGLYEELGAFGTAASIVMPDFYSVVHHHPITIGEYAIATDAKGEVTTLYREFDITVGALVREFGLDACSQTVRNLFDRGALDQWVTIIHAIEPRADRDPRKKDSRNMPWRSVYFELSGGEDRLLRDGGFRVFPCTVPRWNVIGGDVYGSGPGMEALGDIKQLQHEQLRKAQGIDYMTNPPLQVPVSMKNRELDRLPGGVTYVAEAGGEGIRSAFEVRLDMSHLLADIQDVRARINSVFFADLFLMLASAGAANTRMTATEVAERHEEKLLMLGPVMERLHNELLSPLVTMTFERIVDAGILPPPPREVQGMELSVEFISVLAQAQRAVGTNAIDRFVGNLGAIAQFKPEVLDKVDVDQWADAYSEMLGIDPHLIVAADKVALIRQERQQAMERQAQAAAMEQESKVAKNLAMSPVDSNNALGAITNMFSGYSA